MAGAASRITSVGLITALLFAATAATVGANQAHSGVKPKNAVESTVISFLDTAFNQRKYEEAFGKFVGPEYRQHNPTVADGKQAIIDALRQWLPATPALHYEFRHLYSDGNYAIVHSLVTASAADRGKAVVDIFRLEHGKIVEHWDVSQPVPEKSANDNTMF
ncbi:MAG: nuclear transport factor 2 family protein [Proteobacteria bacterium]|nr:nuclear transport factor 2 family protein [Pseudomonadota bacterium]